MAEIPTKVVRADDAPEVDEKRTALVRKLVDKVKRARKHHKPAFDIMREDMDFSRGDQGPEDNDDYYIANFVLRHVNNKTASLYAKNPKIKAERRQKLIYKTWDGDIQSIVEAKQAIQIGQQQDPMGQDILLQGAVQRAKAVVDDYDQGKAFSDMLDKIGRTLESLIDYSINECKPPFKIQAKQAVRRAVTCGIAWCKIGYQRKMGISPDVDAQLADSSKRLKHLQMLTHELKEGEIDPNEAEAEELKLMIDRLMGQEPVILREGLVYSWPKPDSLILDPATSCIKGFVGCGWVAEEFLFTPDRVQEIYGVDVGSGYTAYSAQGEKNNAQVTFNSDGEREENYCLVWEFYDQDSGMKYTMCDGYNDFLVEPGAPDIAIEQFFPFYPITFNDIEDDAKIYPPSDSRLLRNMQLEYNRSRHGLREHRIAARPGLATSAGKLDEEDKDTLRRRPANALVELNGIPPDQPIANHLQPLPYANVDPNLYDVSFVFQDTMRVVGVAEANIGGTSGATATESSIAESTREVGLSSNIDDMDDWLSQIVESSGQVLLMEMSTEQVTDIVGPGAAWPQLTQEDVMKNVFLTIQAGSSGKPNKALEAANWERLLPFVIQMPGIPPKFLVQETLKRMDDRLSVEDVYDAGTPSIVAMNTAGAQPAASPNPFGGGGPATDPTMQGAQGGNKAPSPAPNGPNVVAPHTGQASGGMAVHQKGGGA